MGDRKPVRGKDVGRYNCVMYTRSAAVFSWRAADSSAIDCCFREAGGET